MSTLTVEFLMWVVMAWAFGWAGYTVHSAVRVDCPFAPHWRVGLCVMALAEFGFGLLCGAIALDVHIARLAVL